MTPFRNLVVLSLIITSSAHAIQEQRPLADWTNRSVAICRARVIHNRAFEKSEDSPIFTQTSFQILEVFKGAFAETVQLEHPGGIHNGRADILCGTFDYEYGHEFLLFIGLREDQTLFADNYVPSTDAAYTDQLAELRLNTQTGMDVSGDLYAFTSSKIALATVGVLPGTTGYGSRFLQCDRGEPIEYLVDMDVLPSGITTNEAMTALTSAFAAWTAETSLNFKFAGFESFGQSANTVAISDGRIRVQLHDSYGFITSSTTLGVGGRSYTFTSKWPDGGLGARVGTNEFDRTTRGYLVIEHTASSMSNPVTLEEVLTHEIGHVLSLGHSSETSGETDPYLSEAQMYYQVHKDGRGASLQAWDLANILDFYPTNTPPYGYGRILSTITQSPQPIYASGLNQVGVEAYDVQGAAWVELLTENALESNGTFDLINSNTVFFTPAGNYNNDPIEDAYYAIRYVRITDGVNKSPPYSISVVGFGWDGNKDKLQDSWASSHSVSGADSDADSDGLTNYEEWLLLSDPNDVDSGLQVALSADSLAWDTRYDELYQVQWTDDLTNGFINLGNPQVAPGTNDMLNVELGTEGFYRVQRVK